MGTHKFVLFRLEKDMYAVAIEHVHSISDFVNPTKIPTKDPTNAGVINFRGAIIPIINLNALLLNQFDDPETRSDIDDNKIMVITLEDKFYGLMIDEALQSIEVDEKQIQIIPKVKNSQIDLIHHLVISNDQIYKIIEPRLILGIESEEEVKTLVQKPIDAIEETEQLQLDSN